MAEERRRYRFQRSRRLSGQRAFAAVYGAGVGGGSLVFGAFAAQPDKPDFDMVFPGGTDYDELARTYYPRARQMIRAAPQP